jgi:hypothetical protein
MSAILRAWRSKPAIQHVEQVLHFIKTPDAIDSESQLRLCLRRAEHASSDHKTYFARVLTLWEHWGPSNIQDWMVHEVVMVIGLLHLKTVNERSSLKATFHGNDGTLTLRL